MIRGITEYFFYMYGGIRAEPSYNWRHYCIQVITALVPFTICISLNSIFLYSEDKLLTDHAVAATCGVSTGIIAILYGFLSRTYTNDIENYKIEKNCSRRQSCKFVCFYKSVIQKCVKQNYLN